MKKKIVFLFITFLGFLCVFQYVLKVQIRFKYDIFY